MNTRLRSMTGGAGQSPSRLFRLGRRLRRRLDNADGLALPMAIGIMAVMAIMITAIADYTFSNSRNASNSTAGQLAYTAAESGLNSALSVLYASGSPHLRASLPDVTTAQYLTSSPRYKTSYTYTSSLADPLWTITVESDGSDSSRVTQRYEVVKLGPLMDRLIYQFVPVHRDRRDVNAGLRAGTACTAQGARGPARCRC